MLTTNMIYCLKILVFVSLFGLTLSCAQDEPGKGGTRIGNPPQPSQSYINIPDPEINDLSSVDNTSESFEQTGLRLTTADSDNKNTFNNPVSRFVDGVKSIGSVIEYVNSLEIPEEEVWSETTSLGKQTIYATKEGATDQFSHTGIVCLDDKPVVIARWHEDKSYFFYQRNSEISIPLKDGSGASVTDPALKIGSSVYELKSERTTDTVLSVIYSISGTLDAKEPFINNQKSFKEALKTSQEIGTKNAKYWGVSDYFNSSSETVVPEIYVAGVTDETEKDVLLWYHNQIPQLCKNKPAFDESSATNPGWCGIFEFTETSFAFGGVNRAQTFWQDKPEDLALPESSQLKDVTMDTAIISCPSSETSE